MGGRLMPKSLARSSRNMHLQAVGALPTLLSAQVAFKQLKSLALTEYKSDFEIGKPQTNWQTIELRNIYFNPSFRS